MKATFIELPPFERHRQSYLNDKSFRKFQKMLMKNPEAGDVIEGTGGLRKVRYADEKRGKVERVGSGDLLLVAARKAILAVHRVQQRRDG